jgi:hypothetical protein
MAAYTPPLCSPASFAVATGYAQRPLQFVPAVPDASRRDKEPAEIGRGWERAFDKAFDLKDWR